jgi:hypothetical protein
MKFTKYATRSVNRLLSDLTGRRLIRVRHYREELGQYDKWHEEQALQAVQAIEQHNGQKLSPQIKKLADDYAIDIFGGRAYAPWLYVYSLIRGTFKEGWIPDNFFGEFVVPKGNKALRALTAFKTFSNIVLKTEALPDIAYYIDGIFYGRDFTKIDAALLRKMIARRSTEVFVKRDEVERGEGVMKLSLDDINEGNFKRIGNCVVQWPVQQHAFFDSIITGSVATVRITTVKERDGTFNMREAHLVLGRRDTAWIQSDNSIRVAIVDLDGTLDSVCYASRWRRLPSHPDTNFVFAKQSVPRFADAVKTCIELHALAPHFAVIGWDVAIDHHNTVKVLEWNGEHTGIKFAEATMGPCFVGLGWETLKQ